MTRASDTAKLIGAGATILDGTTISTADNTKQLILESTDADANVGPVLELKRDSSSPADNDYLGYARFVGENDASEETVFAQAFVIANDVSDGTEDATFEIDSMCGGNQTQRLNLNPTETVFNDGSVDLDFRVESNNNANMLFVDGGNDIVAIGKNSSDTIGGFTNTLQVEGTGATSSSISVTRNSNDTNPAYLQFGKSRGTSVGSNTIVQDDDEIAQITFNAADGTNRDTPAASIRCSVDGTPGENDMPGRLMFHTTADGASSSTERARIDSTGRLLFGTSTTTLTDTAGFTVQIGGASNTIGLTTASQLGGIAFIANRNSDDGTVIQIRQANSVEGSISVSGSTTSYNAFSASHWSRLADNSKPTILKGTIIETIDEMCDWYRVKFTVAKTEEKEEYTEQVSIELPSGKKEGDIISYTHEGITYDDAVIVKEDDNKHTKCKISDTADSKKVYGVHADWDNDDDTVNDMYVTAVGTHVVRINKDVTVTAGDLLSSNGDGTAKVQDDDIIRSKTIGKVLTNIKQETYSDGSYTVPCALYCG